MRFSKVYSELVLSENFADSKRLFFRQLMDIHRAHLVMLVRCGILPVEEGRALAKGLSRITWEKVQPIGFDGSFEDLFCCLESLLGEACGSEIAGKLHTARSRNDIDVTLYRLRWREDLGAVIGATLELRRALLEICGREKETLFPVYTHTQPAQPSTLAHYFLGIVEHLERDHRRLRSALKNMNHSPLGSCAATGTGFPIDRELVASLLAFDGPTGNTLSSIAAADYLLEAVGAIQVLLTMTSRLLHDVLLWSMREFQFLRLADGLVQPSSIMPQKRNPVAAEHSRALASRALGKASACFQMLHNTPHGDIVDVEDDLQPLVESLFQDTWKVLRVLAEVLRTAEFDREALARRAEADWITVTELADTLVREQGIPFKTAHAVVSAMIRVYETDTSAGLERALALASREVTGRTFPLDEARLQEILSPQHFVELRGHLGGPAVRETSRALALAQEQLSQDENWTQSVIRRFQDFRPQLDRLVEEL